MSVPPGPPVGPPPQVEHPRIAAALQELADLEDRPLAEHQGRLTRAHEVLHEVLHPAPGAR